MELEIRVPMSTRAFFTNAQVPGLKSKLAGIGAKYQNLIASASTLTGGADNLRYFYRKRRQRKSPQPLRCGGPHAGGP